MVTATAGRTVQVTIRSINKEAKWEHSHVLFNTVTDACTDAEMSIHPIELSVYIFEFEFYRESTHLTVHTSAYLKLKYVSSKEVKWSTIVLN
jgi:hypothetical protein